MNDGVSDIVSDGVSDGVSVGVDVGEVDVPRSDVGAVGAALPTLAEARGFDRAPNCTETVLKM